MFYSRDGISAFTEIVRRTEKRSDFDAIPGVSFMRNGDPIPTKPGPHPDLDELAGIEEECIFFADNESLVNQDEEYYLLYRKYISFSDGMKIVRRFPVR